MKLFNNLSKSKRIIYTTGVAVFIISIITYISIDKTVDIKIILFFIWVILNIIILIWTENKKTILMIEDEEILTNLYKRVLEDAGYKTITLSETTKAYKILDKEKVDLITLDIMLPHQDGLEFLNEIKSIKKYKKFPIIMFNNLTNQDIIDKCYELGAKDYWITSEILPEELPGKIEKFFNSK